MNLARTAALMGALLTVWTSNASALDYPSGFYVEGALGFARISSTACESLPGTLGSQFDCNKDDASYEVMVGWQPFKWAGIEAGYVDLGESRATGGGTSLKASADGAVVAVTFTAPFAERIGLYGRVGAFIYEGELTGNLGVIPLPPSVTPPITEDETVPVIGLGFRWPLGDHLGIGMRWDRYFDVGNDTVFSGGESDVDNFSARLMWNF